MNLEEKRDEETHLGIAMHGITTPDRLVGSLENGFNMTGEVLLNLASTVSRNQCHFTRFTVWIKDIENIHQLLRLHRRSNLDTDWILDTSKVFDMSAVQLTSTVSNPQEM